jgi:integrase/recombinase XerD
VNLALWKTRFGEYLQLRQFSPRTVDNYVAELKPFFEFLDLMAVRDLASVTRDVIEEYRTHLFYAEHQGRKLSARTQGSKLGAIKAFTRFLNRERFLLADPSAGVELPRAPRFTPPPLLSEDEVERLIEAPDTSTWLGLRDRAILELLYGTGLRNQEMRRMTLEEVDLERQEIRLARGKGGKGRVIPLGEEAAAWLRTYLDRGRPVLVRTPAEKTLFLSARGLPMPSMTLGAVVSRATRKAGLGKRVTPHVLRHCYATHLMRAGASVRHVQALLGHECLSTTQRYTKVEVSDLRLVVERFHPRERGLRP